MWLEVFACVCECVRVCVRARVHAFLSSSSPCMRFDRMRVQQGVPGQSVELDDVGALCKEILARSPTHVVPHFQW